MDAGISEEKISKFERLMAGVVLDAYPIPLIL
jgi:hypothetical protein